MTRISFPTGQVCAFHALRSCRTLIDLSGQMSVASAARRPSPARGQKCSALHSRRESDVVDDDADDGALPLQAERVPLLFQAPGFPTTRRRGNSKFELRIAALTRSRASETAASGMPTIVKCGRPFATSASTVTIALSSPHRAHAETRATERAACGGATTVAIRRSVGGRRQR
jgi:hypothetical protein